MTGGDHLPHNRSSFGPFTESLTSEPTFML